MALKAHMRWCLTDVFSRKKWENGPKTGFFEFMFCNENLYYFCSFTNLYLGRILFLRYSLKCSQPIRLLGFLNQPLLQNKSVKPNFLHVVTNSQKLKVDRKFFGWLWSKMGVANLVSIL